jgi:ectoine hydroxylase-related dioxygenase (phytanoyl-CoA dioxygenase family)
MSDAGLAESATQPAVRRFSRAELDTMRASFQRDGYFVIRELIPRATLAALHQRLTTAFTEMEREGALFSGGGRLSGHLNCFPGAESKVVYDMLVDAGIVGLIKEIEPKAVRLPNVGCNYNLPGSTTQHYHTDYDFSKGFMIANIAVVDTTIANGAMEAAPGTHTKFYPYWRFAIERAARDAVRVEMKAGDVMVRTSSMWHRGMPNMTQVARPMMAFTWEDGGSTIADPFMKESGAIKFYPNWFRPTTVGRIRERTTVAAPIIYSSYRFVSSLFSNKGN